LPDFRVKRTIVKSRIPKVVLAVLVVLTLGLAVIAPANLSNNAQVAEIEGDLTDWLEERESRANAFEALIPDTAKRIRWYQERRNSKTPYSIVYLHGFSATRQEIAPVGAMVADALGANLFETRLAGHGQLQHALEGVRAEDWLDDAAEALSIGALIGDRVILVGTSTGATLALAMAGHPSFQAVNTIVLLSPNFAVQDTKAEFLTWPGGPQLAYIVAGTTRSWTAQNELQARFWSTTYPMDAAIEMMRLVKYVRGRLPMHLEQSVLTIYSPADTVVDVGWIIRGFEELDSPRKQLVELPGSNDASNHVLAGDIMAPENNEPVSALITGFVLAGQQEN
jgi:esterase/lipase